MGITSITWEEFETYNKVESPMPYDFRVHEYIMVNIIRLKNLVLLQFDKFLKLIIQILVTIYPESEQLKSLDF